MFKRILLFASLFLYSVAHSQVSLGDSCTIPIFLAGVPDTSSGYISDNRIEAWYSFESIAPTVRITVTNTTATPGLYDKVVLYKGVCGGLAALDSAEAFGDTTFMLTRQFMFPDVYYIKITKPEPCKTCTNPIATVNLRIEQEFEQWCAFDRRNDFLRTINPGYTVQMTAQDQYIYNYITTHSNTAGPFTIPVVVHVVHYGDAYGTGNNITYDQVLWQIAGMNAAFQHDYANYNQEGYGHNYLGYGQQDYSSNPQVRFCLAERGRDSSLNVIPYFYNTMSGDTECGVMRYDLTHPMYSSIPNIDSLNAYDITNIADEQTLLDVTRPGTEFPNNMYFNIYLVPQICQTTQTPQGPVTSCGVIGVGTMGAFNSLTGELDGVVFRADAFGDNSVAGNTFTLFPGLEEGKIMDHEAGHYLSLYHTFQPDSAQNIGCYGTQLATAAFNQCDRHGDYCCDTPPDAHFFTIPFAFTSTLNTCNETYFPPAPASDHRDMNENYMDYSDDNWYNTFTFDQSMRVSAMLDVGGPRHSLVTLSNLSLTGVSDTGKCHCCVLAANIVPPSDSICVGSGVQFITPTGNGFCATSWSWQFPGGSPSTSNLPNPVVTYSSAGTYTVILTATDGVDTVTSTATVFVVNSTVTIAAVNTSDTVCSGEHQHLVLHFVGGVQPYSVSICDQNNNVVASRNNIFATTSVIQIPVTLTSNQFFICSATNGAGCSVDTIVGNASFQVKECCPNLFVNGDFEAVGAPGCNIAPATSEVPCGSYNTGAHNTYNPIIPFLGWPIVPPYDGSNGIGMVVDCQAAPIHTTPVSYTQIWTQTVNLEQGVHYSLQFDFSNHYGNLATNLNPYLGGVQQLFLQFKINGVFVGTPVNVPYSHRGSVWNTYTIDWIKSTATGVDTVSICQVDPPPNTDMNFGPGGFDYLLDNITIRAMDLPGVLAGPDAIICPGGFAPIGSSLNDIDGSYLWAPNSGVACDTCFFTTASPAATTQYVITNQQRGCIVTDTTLISVVPITVTASATPNPACIGSPIQLQAIASGTPPYAYTWLPVTNLSNPAIANPTITSYNGTTITYTVFISDAKGCSASDSVQITVDPSCCVATNYTPDTLFTSIATGNYAMNQDLYISGNVTISGVDMLIGTNHSIIVLTGSTLTITGASHLHACYQMWQGIVLRPGANVVVNGNSLIEDAYTAINCINAPSAGITLTNAIFNKNQIAVLAQTWTGALNFNMVNCRITCRQLPANPTVGLLTPGFLTGLPQSNLIAPLTSQRAFSGVQFLNGGSITIGSLIPAATNVFDYLDHGVIGVNTNFIVRNNWFQNMLQPCVGPPSCSNNAGTAITANDPTMVVGSPGTYNTVQIGGASSSVGNTFIDCWRSVDLTRYVNVTVRYNRVNSTSTVIAPPNLVNLNGDHGVFIRTTYAQVMEVTNNDIRNQARGIHINLSAGGLGYNTINVRDNFLTTAITPTTFTNVGIQVDGISGVFFLTNNFLNIEGDTVLNANTCIQVRNIRNAVRVFSNGELKIRPNPTTTPGPNKTGIFVQNCEFVFIQDNLNIHSTGTALDSNNRNIRGIWVFNCAQSTVCNNWIRRVGQCLAFEGSCQFSTVRLDRFSDSYDGFVMRNNAVIGQQGNGTHPWDCRFLSGLTNHTYVYFSPNVNTNSRMFVRSTAPYYPTVNSALFPNQVYIPSTVGPIFIAAACGATPPTLMNQQALRQAIAQNQVGYNSFPNEARVANQKRLYKELHDNPVLMLGDTVLQNFYINNTPADLGFINSTEAEVEQGNSSSAASYNSNITGLTNSEWNQKIFNSIFLLTLMQGVDTLTSQQMNDLVNIAQQCPNQGGDAVWQSRALIDWMTHSANDFGDTCLGENTRLVGSESTTQQESSVYPNPNAGSVTVNYELSGTANATFEVFDLTGRVISVTKLDTKQSQQVIDLMELANGPYVYKIIGDGDLVDTGTLIISK